MYIAKQQPNTHAIHNTYLLCPYNALYCSQAEVVELKAQLKKAQKKYDILQ